MQISTKGRYAMRLMLDIAKYGRGETVKIKDIADRQDISPKYLEQIISELNRAGLVKSTRGPQGGYSLAKSPEEYTVGSILRVMEGDLSVVQCVKDGEEFCDRYDTCTTVRLWRKVSDAISSVVDNVTLADLLRWEAEKNIIAIDGSEKE
ncbi:MAG: Rrf2 family transcriptional regulator [Candidatus Methanomethylophilaceae archaeon]